RETGARHDPGSAAPRALGQGRHEGRASGSARRPAARPRRREGPGPRSELGRTVIVKLIEIPRKRARARARTRSSPKEIGQGHGHGYAYGREYEDRPSLDLLRLAGGEFRDEGVAGGEDAGFVLAVEGELRLVGRVHP